MVSHAEPRQLPATMRIALFAMAGAFSLLSVAIICLSLPSAIVTPTNALLTGAGLFFAVVPQILRRTRYTLTFIFPFVGGLAMAMASLVDAFDSVVDAGGQTFTIACVGLGLVLIGFLVDLRDRQSVWIWQQAPWGVDMDRWPRWEAARRWLVFLSVISLLCLPLLHRSTTSSVW